MSYCRFSHADAYIYDDVAGYCRCCGCSLLDDFHTTDLDEMLSHIAAHRAAGDYIPKDVDEVMREEWHLLYGDDSE